MEIEFKVGVPLGRQLEDVLRVAIRSGRLGPGSVLPPSRDLADELGVSRGVVVDSYSQLAAEGYLSAKRGSGTRVAEGDAVFSPRLAGFVLDAFGGAEAPVIDPELDQLTNREREVLRLIARGYAYKEIARRLEISVKTVETHVSAVLRKLQLSSRHELSRWAADRRLT